MRRDAVMLPAAKHIDDAYDKGAPRWLGWRGVLMSGALAPRLQKPGMARARAALGRRKGRAAGGYPPLGGVLTVIR